MSRQRLDKLVADNVMLSRKQAKELIRAGRVGVNGDAVKSGEHQVAQEDAVTLDGKAIRNQVHIYIMMNKPAGVLSATRDKNAPTALDLLPEALRRKNLFPAGRLDKDSEGFLLITDDGAFAHNILSPVNRVPKTY
jgi:16S rRNA pseudouridine516 synthase